MNPPTLTHHRSVEDQYPTPHHHYHAQSRPQQPQAEVATALHPNPYSKPHPAHYAYSSAAQSPPSPPEDEVNKPSLPSISSLLTMADTDRPSQDSASQTQSQQGYTGANKSRRESAESQPEQAAQTYGLAIASNPRVALPPTPPMRPDSTVDGNQSPSTLSSQSNFSSQPYQLGQTLNNLEPHQQRQAATAVQLPKRPSIPSQASMSPYANSPYGSSPGALSSGSYYSPEHPIYGAPPIYGQRPLPSNFPPAQPVQVNGPLGGAGNPWQHHHYISASSQATFPQSQDRYICQTCNKAFSRPSSLRIHSHSHTGEKPFKCPHAGCGKAFSVRSNMKRHERGCHSGNPSAVSAQ
ncbi:hypothetical protein EV356DRAFT_529721 [Viridothelium virens]|uniref:C2H2-type domain-containing protein n=1 Tax=Viridothelium virens TaxID=1048519 RepID=A0A6A6HIL9_VIRVR|nr:hypothetical protein EV356DRAFT_529721 [Viridothelium virens]